GAGLPGPSARRAVGAAVARGPLGADLKRKEKLPGRFPAVLSWLSLGSAVLRRLGAGGRRPEDLPLMRWAMEHAFLRMQTAFEGVFQNLEVPGLTWFLRGPVSWLTRLCALGHGPSDRLGNRVARTLLQPGEHRDRLTPLLHLPP